MLILTESKKCLGQSSFEPPMVEIGRGVLGQSWSLNWPKGRVVPLVCHERSIRSYLKYLVLLRVCQVNP